MAEIAPFFCGSHGCIEAVVMEIQHGEDKLRNVGNENLAENILLVLQSI